MIDSYFEVFKKEYIMPGIHRIIQEVVSEEIQKAQDAVAKRVKERVGMIAVNLARQFDVMHMRNEIVISFRDDDAIQGEKT